MISLFWLDDADLSPKAVRLLIHYVCEARNNKVSTRLRQVSIVCHMPPSSVRAAEAELVDAGLLEPRVGRSLGVRRGLR